MSKSTLHNPNFVGSVPLAFNQDEFDEDFYCDFNLDLSTLSAEELSLHNEMAEYSAASINANLYALDPSDPSYEKREHRMRHKKAIYNAYRKKIGVEFARRKASRPYTGKTLADYFMVSAKKMLSPSLYQEILSSATEYYNG
jgi:hypothetical protein